MNKGIDLTITPIRPRTKESTKEMEGYLSEINDTLYFFRNLYINDKAKKYILKELERVGNKLKTLMFTRDSSQLVRRQEILGDMRLIYQNLKGYVVNDFADEETLPEIEKMNAYYTAMFLKDKRENNLTVDKQLEWLKHINRFNEFYPNVKLTYQKLDDYVNTL